MAPRKPKGVSRHGLPIFTPEQMDDIRIEYVDYDHTQKIEAAQEREANALNSDVYVTDEYKEDEVILEDDDR